ncbi:MAG: hypothetical protein H0X29_01140 [Parachlamydiaceae bacterium]|nr:hypothetical protein [Parachlamydiaceae bacterium]
MGHKHSSLAFDDDLKEFDSGHQIGNHYEPELKIHVNVHYAKNLGMNAVSLSDIVQVSGKITVSF